MKRKEIIRAIVTESAEFERLCAEKGDAYWDAEDHGAHNQRQIILGWLLEDRL